MKIDQTIRHTNREPERRKSLSPIAARHIEYIEFLGSIGLNQSRISEAIDKNRAFVANSLANQSIPRDDTIDAYAAHLFLNRNWLMIGRGEMITDIVALRAFADSVAHKKRGKVRGKP